MIMSRFSEYLDQWPPVGPALPLVHTCRALDFREVLASGNLQPVMCDVFKEDLAYLFYGRPAFRLGAPNEPTDLDACYPVVLVMSPAINCSKVRVAPFDTGAWERGLYQAHCAPGMKLEDFCLPPDAIPGRIVAAFFGNNESYYDANPGELNAKTLDFEAKSYHAIISNAGAASVDDRRGTIEVQVDQPVVITPEHVLKILVPQPWVKDDALLEHIRLRWGCSIRGYPTFRCRPADLTPLLLAYVRDYLKEENYF
jgi:hypothetical protein